MSSPSYGTLLGRAARLRCPRCGIGPLFSRLLAMPRACAHCGFVYERAPGFFLGSAYLNYGVTCLSLMVLYMALHYGWGWTNRQLAAPLMAYCIVWPLVFFRYARAWWLAMDCFFDKPEPMLDPPIAPPVAADDDTGNS